MTTVCGQLQGKENKMWNSDRIIILRNEARDLIKKNVTSGDPLFIKWRTKMSRFLIESFGEDSTENKKFSKRGFRSYSMMLNDLKPTHQQQVDACANGLEFCVAELDAYIEIAVEAEQSLDIQDSMEEPVKKEKKIIISHAHDDKLYVKEIVELLESVGLSENEIVCSSVPPYCIPLGNNIYQWLADKFQNCEIYAIYILSHNYYKSAACLNEMGAVWVMKQKYNGILLPGFNFSEIVGCVDREQISIKLDDPDLANLKFRLEELINELIQEYDLRPLNHALWERKRDEFLEKIGEISSSCESEE